MIAYEAGAITKVEEAILRSFLIVQVSEWCRWVHTSDLFQLR